MIQIWLAIEPVAWARTRVNPRTGQFITAARMRRFQTDVRYLLGQRVPARGALRIRLDFYMRPPKRRARTHPSVKPDLSNLQKNIEDAANGILWRDDAQIVEVIARKLYDWSTRKVGIQIQIEEIDLVKSEERKNG